MDSAPPPPDGTPRASEPEEVSSSDGTITSGSGELKKQLTAQVFGNQLLMDKILDYALYDNWSQELCYEDLVDIRRVSHSWKVAVSKALKRNKQALYKVRMTEENSLNGTPDVESQGKILDNFVRFLDTLGESKNVYKVFELIIEEEVFRLETYNHLLTCLGQCGNQLVVLNLKIPEKGGSLPGLFPNTLTFPALRKLKVNFTGRQLESVPASETLSLPPGNVTLLLQSLLTKSSNLKELFIEGCTPSSFQFMDVPESLVDIDLECEDVDGNPEIFQCLLRNRLPDLKKLRMVDSFHRKASVTQDVIYQVFQKFAKTLHDLTFQETYRYEPPRVPVGLRFPVMEKMQKLEIWNMHSELENEIKCLPALFPKLKSLILLGQSEEMIRKWTLDAKAAPQVIDFTLQMADEEDLDDGNWSNTLPVSAEIIRSIRITFPNITDLKLYHLGTQFAGLQCVFRETGRLKRLTIYVHGESEVETSDNWDSALIGAPLELVVGLAACPRSVWKGVKLDIANVPSVKMLTELTHFHLDDNRNSEDRGPLISDLTFIYAFNEMVKLEHVKLCGKFSVSKEIKDEWKNHGRTLEIAL